MHILWWHWVVLGSVLMLLEFAVPSLFLARFGLASLIVGALLATYPVLPFALQFLAWIAFSLLFIGLWKVFKPGYTSRVSGGSLIGVVGLVTRDIRPHEKGEIRIHKPMLGKEVWESVADEEIRVGEQVRVQQVEGNTLRVSRVA